MKKISLLTILFFSVAFLYAQSSITFRVDMTNHLNDGGTIDATGMHVAGNFQIAAGGTADWTPSETPMTDVGSNIWEATVMLPDGDYEYKFVLANDWGSGDETVNGDCAVEGGGNRVLTVAGADQTLDFCYSSCDLCDIVYPTTMVTLTIYDSNEDITAVSMKGAYGGWAEVPAFDDGTNGDVTAGDHIWTLVVEAEYEPDGSPRNYGWGGVRTDCAAPAWLIQGPNREFTVATDGSVTGDTNYDIPVADVTYNVTFRVNMENEVVSSEGLAVSGNFETCAWSKMDILLTQSAADPNVWEATTPVSPGMYEYKYFNGGLGTDDETESVGNFTNVFIDNGCGVDGTQNRALDLTALDADMILPVYTFNSCDEYFLVSNDNELELNQFEITPNPARSLAVVEFTNDNAIAYDLIITNITGQTVHTINNLTTNRVEVSVEEMAAGMYFATLRNQEGATTTRKLIVR